METITHDDGRVELIPEALGEIAASPLISHGRLKELIPELVKRVAI